MPEDWIVRNYSDKYELAFTRFSDNLPFVKFELSEERPCMLEDELNVTPNRYFYELEVASSKAGCKT